MSVPKIALVAAAFLFVAGWVIAGPAAPTPIAAAPQAEKAKDVEGPEGTSGRQLGMYPKALGQECCCCCCKMGKGKPHPMDRPMRCGEGGPMMGKMQPGPEGPMMGRTMKGKMMKMMKGHHAKGPRLGMLLRHADELGLTEKQREKIEDLLYSTRKRMVDLRAEVQKKAIDLKRLVRDEEASLTSIERHMRSLMEAKVALRMAGIEAHRKALAILTPEQREQLKKHHRRCQGPRPMMMKTEMGGDSETKMMILVESEEDFAGIPSDEDFDLEILEDPDLE
jgi:Spy/CpxP family protein refolding chaperone